MQAPKRAKIWFRRCLAFALMLIQSACWHSPAAPSSASGGATGALAIAAQVTAAPVHPLETDGPSVLHIRLRQGRLELERTLPVQDGRAAGTLHGIYEGRWQVLLEVRDQEGYITHRGEAEVQVTADRSPVLLEMALQPLPGRLRVVADLTGFSAQEQVSRARLVSMPGEKRFESLREPGSPFIRWDVELAPGSYELQVQLYGDSFHAYNLIYAAPWMSLDVYPGRSSELTWSPATGEIQLVGTIPTLPAAPRGLVVWQEGDEVVLQWLVTSPDAAESVLYWKKGPLDPFEELIRLPVEEPPPPGHERPATYRHRPGDDGAPGGAWLTYAVATADFWGRISRRVQAPALVWSGP